LSKADPLQLEPLISRKAPDMEFRRSQCETRSRAKMACR
jgi:hypothetical protein